MIPESPGTSRGFTVVELVVAMSISAVTLLSGYELFETLRRAGNAQSADLATAAQITHGLNTIRDDLWHAVPRTESQGPMFLGGNPDPDQSANMTTVLEFYTLGAGRGDERFGSLRQMYQVTYELVRDGGLLRLNRKAAAVTASGRTSSDEDRVQILDRLEQVKIAFRNGRTSEPSFSSDEQLPACVELVVTAYGRTWPLSVNLPCGGSEVQP